VNSKFCKGQKVAALYNDAYYSATITNIKNSYFEDEVQYQVQETDGPTRKTWIVTDKEMNIVK
jgi:hypothetical protein